MAPICNNQSHTDANVQKGGALKICETAERLTKKALQRRIPKRNQCHVAEICQAQKYPLCVLSHLTQLDHKINRS
jgi:hypothetical protein